MDNGISLHETLIKASFKSVSIQHKDGSFRHGHNGPYGHVETPVRNTAHWLSVICYALKSGSLSTTEAERLKSSACRAVEYLLSHEPRPHGSSFFCRKSPGKDSCNGLIGQAWTIEGLMEAYNVLNLESARNTALEVFFLHPFDYEKGLWNRVDIDGSIIGFDYTFNHQLWFAAIAMQLADARAERMARRFFDTVGKNIETYSDGVIFHAANIEKFSFSDIKNPYNCVKKIRGALNRVKLRKSLYAKSVGYHSFNLYAYAMLKNHLQEHEFWRSDRFSKMLLVTNNESFLRCLHGNPYGFPYNPTGIELSYVGRVFSLGDEYVQKWLSLQYDKTYDSMSEDLMIRGSLDDATSSARVYEAARAADYSQCVKKT